MTRPLRCTAGHVVGVEHDTHEGVYVVINHHGRQYVVYGVVVLRCGCGATWRPDAALPLEGLERKMPTLAGRP